MGFRKKVRIIFGGERRKNRQKRQFVDEIISNIMETYPDSEREIVAINVTYTISAMRKLYKDCGRDEMISVLFENE